MKFKVSVLLILLLVQSVSAQTAGNGIEITGIGISIDEGGLVSIEEKVIVKGDVNSATFLIPGDVEIVSVYSGGEGLRYELQDYEMVKNGTNGTTRTIDVSKITVFFPESSSEPWMLH